MLSEENRPDLCLFKSVFIIYLFRCVMCISMVKTTSMSKCERGSCLVSLCAFGASPGEED